MEKIGVWEGVAYVLEEDHQLDVAQNAPTGQGNLERPKPHVVGEPQPLDDVRRGQANNPDHRTHGLALSLLPEYLDDYLESGRVDGVTLARCPENVQVLETPLQGDLHLFAEDILHQVFVFVPRDFAGHQNCLRVTGHVIILYW